MILDSAQTGGASSSDFMMPQTWGKVQVLKKCQFSRQHANMKNAKTFHDLINI